MQISYDLHIHTGLSPCALDEMTPNNICNMALVCGLDVIGISDHNSCGNVKAVIEAAGGRLIVIPGLEVETREEIHVLTLFETLEQALKMQKLVYGHLPKRKNDTSLIGHQFIFDAQDEILGEEEHLLSFATDLSMERVLSEVWELGGIAIPAHIDRPSYSVLSNLGILPENPYIQTLEISPYADLEKYKKKFHKYQLVQSSDAHELGYIGISERTLDIKSNQLEAKAIIRSLRRDEEDGLR